MADIGQTDQILITGRLAYGWDGTNAYPVLVDSARHLQIDIVSGTLNGALPAGTAVIGGVMPPIVEVIHHPFGKGSLISGGDQTSAGTTTASTVMVAVEAVTINQPANYTLYEIEMGLMGQTNASATTAATKYAWQASDAGTAWQALCADQTASTASTAYVDTLNMSGRFAPAGSFLGAGSTFVVRMVIEAADTTITAGGKTKASSYIVCRYRR